MTMEDACYYIGCSYTYFITRLVDKILHIRINTAARKLIYLYGNIYGGLDEDLQLLVNKRILLNKEDFFNYIRSTILIEQKYKVFTYDNFDFSILDQIQENLNIYNSKHGIEGFVKSIESLFYDVVLGMSDKHNPMSFTVPEGYVARPQSRI